MQLPFPPLRLLALVYCLSISMALATEQKRGAFYGAMATEYPAWFKSSFLNLPEDIAEAAAQKKRVMLLFTQENCPYCNALVERNLAQQDIEHLLKTRFDVIAVNMWGDKEVTAMDGKRYTEKSFAAQQKVQFTPTLLFFDETGKNVLRLNGYLPPAKFKIALDYIAQAKEKELSYRDYVASVAPPPSSGELIQEPFFRPPPYRLIAQAKSKPLVVVFEQKDCPACNDLHSKILSDAETRNLLKNFDAVQLDMWSSVPVITPQGKATTARAWAKELDIKYAPTLVVFNPQGKEIIRSEAFFKTFHTQGILAYVAEAAYKTEPSFQRYLSARAEKFREQGQDVDIWRMEEVSKQNRPQ